jgi:DNA-binding CsgD family transcriptional regulator
MAQRLLGEDRSRSRYRRAFGLSDHELVCIFAAAELDGYDAAGQVLGMSEESVKKTIGRARKKAGVRSALTLYHRLVRGVRFETHVTTRAVVEED